ncbi:unnamed protein product [Cunninghamella blakesleeana]
MGCCGSKEEREDDIQEPLLNNDTNNDSRLNYQACDIINPKQEQEFWNNVIDRTTQNLIDISSSQTDALQEQDIHERAEKYHDLLSQIQLNHHQNDINNKLNGTPTTTTATTVNHHSYSDLDTLNIDALINTAKVNHELLKDQNEWLNEIINDIQQALSHFEVQNVGDLVIPLATPNNIHIQSH